MKFLEFYLRFHNRNEIWHSFSRAPIRNFPWCYYRPLITSLILEKCKKIMQYSLNYSGVRLLSTETKILNILVDSVFIFCILYVSQETLVCYHNPCHHGGTCVENPLAPCVCPNGYIGPHCEGNILGQVLL